MCDSLFPEGSWTLRTFPIFCSWCGMKISRARFHLGTVPLYLTIYLQISALCHLSVISSPVSFIFRTSPLAAPLDLFLLHHESSFLSVSHSFGLKYKPHLWYGIFIGGFTTLKLFDFKGWKPNANKLRQNPKFMSS